MKLSADRGNAIVEFIVVGLFAQLAVLGLLINVGSDFRSQLAAESLGRQALRSYQLTSSLDSAQATAAQVISVFGIDSKKVTINIQDNCSSTSSIDVAVVVRNKKYQTRGFCLG